MFPPIDWMVQLEESRQSLSRSGQQRFALLAALKQKVTKGAKKTADKQAAETGEARVQCCEAAAA